MTLIHCWKDKSTYMMEKYGRGSEEHVAAYFNNGTCLLLKGHDGEHQFTDDKSIQIRFIEEKPKDE